MNAIRRTLITGASGFLGGRLVEKLLLDPRWSVRAMAHRPGRTVRLARHEVEIVWADLRKADDLKRAVEGVDAVVHCAYGADASVHRATTVEGTRLLVQAAREAGVQRFVHISTIGVHSYSPPPVVTEDSSYVKSGDAYCNAKIEAERIVRRLNPSAVVLRMGNIYGPFSAPWTVRPLAHIRAGKVSLVEDGEHVSNMVFVDNAVEAILQSLDSDKATGEVFFITDDPCQWNDIYGHYAHWLGDTSLRSATREEIRPLINPSWGEQTASFAGDIWNGIVVPSFRYTAFRAAVSPRLGPFLSSLWQKVPVPVRYRIVGDPLGRSIPAAAVSNAAFDPYPAPSLLAIYAGRTVFSNEKAKRILGFGPRVSQRSALERTRLWAEWARLTGPTE